MSDRSAGDRWMRIAAALAAAGVLLHLLQFELLPFVLAGIVGFLADPLLAWLTRKTGAPRWLTATVLFLLMVSALGALAYETVVNAGADLLQMAKSGFGPLQSGLQGLLGDKGVSLFGTTVSASSVVSALRSDLPKLLTPGALSRLATPAFGAGIGLILFIFLTFYMLVSGRELARGALWLVPPDKRAAVTDVLPEAAAIIRRYFLGVIVVVVVTAFAAWLGYGLVLHVKNAVLLCITLGALETVPVIGPIIAAVLIAIAALQLKSLAAMAAMVIYAAALRLGIDDVIAPIVLGRSVTAHPVVVMLAYVLGAVLFGVVGLLLAVPATAVARLCLERLYQGEEAATSLRLFPKRR